MKLIDDWQSAWKKFSVQIAALAVGFGALPSDTQSAILEAVGVPQARLASVLGVVFLLGRLISQSKE